MKVPATKKQWKTIQWLFCLVRNLGIQATFRCLVRGLLYWIQFFGKLLLTCGMGMSNSLNSRRPGGALPAPPRTSCIFLSFVHSFPGFCELLLLLPTPVVLLGGLPSSPRDALPVHKKHQRIYLHTVRFSPWWTGASSVPTLPGIRTNSGV